MVMLTLVVAILLIVIGVLGYVITDMVSVTALIPAMFGAVLGVLGMLGQSPARRRMAMHMAMGVALVGIIGSIGGLLPAIQWLGGTPIDRPAAAISRALMAVTLIVYLAMGVRSFIAARAK